MSPTERKRSGRRRVVLPLAGAALALAVVAYLGWQPSERAGFEPPASDRPAEPAGGTRTTEAPAPPTAREPPATAEQPSGERLQAREPVDAQPHEILAAMRNTWECYVAADCSVGEEGDPRAEYFAADRQLAAGMRTLIEQHRAGHIGDVELAAAAREALGYDSGRARAAAIEALDALPPADEHLDTLIGTLDQHHDEKLFELALPQLRRYAESGHRETVDAFLQSNLRSGAHFPARTIARELGPFLTAENIASYRALADDLPEESRHAELLRQTLRAYDAR
jgi:hypothetical protein